MSGCVKELNCAFVHCEEQFKVLPAIAVYEEKYCHGEEATNCIRFKLDEKFGKVQVPSNMMPNGLPLPGTHRRDWTISAINYKRYLENREY